MELTGECKDDFLVWYFNSYIKKDKYCLIKDVERFFKSVKPAFQNALIIEFFDSVEYNQNISLWNYCFSNAYWNRGLKEYNQSIKEAIKKANEIYNSLI